MAVIINRIVSTVGAADVTLDPGGIEAMMEAYYLRIDNAAANSENVEIPNKDAQHAAYLLMTIFKNAKREVRIFTGALFNGVYGNNDLKKAAESFLQLPNAVLKIAYQSQVSQEEIKASVFLKKLSDDPARKGKIEVFDSSQSFPDLKNHFAVADDKAYRLEIDHEKREAIGNFGDPIGAKKLADAFEKILLRSQRVVAV
jgi:hypothetical protein